MNLKAWETTINQIVADARQEIRESAQQRILLAWRAKLEGEPFSLQPYQIDEVVREARKRFAKGPNL